MANYLGIDTSSTYLTLGLWSKDTSFKSLELEIERDHTKRILSELECFLTKNDIQKQSLQGICVGLGPGSYTGIRVGVATAKGLAKGLAIPLKGCSSLEAMAQRCLKPEQTAVIAIDARRDNVYYGIFEKQSSGLKQVTALAKENRAVLQEKHADLAWFESIVPDANYLAQQAGQTSRKDIEAIYL